MVLIVSDNMVVIKVDFDPLCGLVKDVQKNQGQLGLPWTEVLISFSILKLMNSYRLPS